MAARWRWGSVFCGEYCPFAGIFKVTFKTDYFILGLSKFSVFLFYLFIYFEGEGVVS